MQDDTYKNRRLLLVALGLVALNLRPALASISPLLETIRTDLQLSGATAGLLTTIPGVCMGVFAFITGVLIRRFGLERTIFWGVGLVGITTLARIAGQNVIVLYASTIGVGMGIAITQALLPSVVSRYFRDKAALITGFYTAIFNAGAVLAAAAAVPLQQLTDSWPISLAVWSVLAIPAMLLWRSATRGTVTGGNVKGADQSDLPQFVSPWRRPRAWFLAIFLAGSSTLYLSTLTWLAARYQAVGLSASDSGFLFAFFTVMQIVGSLLIPAMAQRTVDRRPWLALVLVLITIGMLAIAFVPLSLPYVSMILIGLGIGGVFPLTLTLPLDYASHPIEVGRLTSMTLGLGYLLASAGPFGLGALSDWVGGYTMPFAVLAAIAGIMLLGALVVLNPPRAETSH